MANSTSVLGRWLNPPAPPTSTDPDPQPPVDIKDPVTGIGPRSAGSILGRARDVGFVVADCHWSDLQPVEDGPISQSTTAPLGWNQIAVARANNLPYRLRVHAGDEAPTWAKNVGGSAITVLKTEQKPGDPPPGNVTFTVGRWWTTAYLNAWGELMRRLAALLDDDPLCREVASHPATTNYAEPFMRGTNPTEALVGPNAGKSNIQVFYEAMVGSGVSPADAQVAMSGSTVVGPSTADAAALLWPSDMVTVSGVRMTRWQSFGWEKTRYYIPFNPLQQWRVTNTNPFTFSNITDPGGWTNTAISTYEQNFGTHRVILANNSFRVPTFGANSAMAKMYKYLTDTGATNSYQTATQDLLDQQYRTVAGAGATSAQSLGAAVKVAIGMMTAANDSPNGLVTAPITGLRARSVELPPGWQNNISAADAAVWNDFAAGNSIGG